MEDLIIKVGKLIKSSYNYSVQQNVFHFILDENDRPTTPKYLSKELCELYPNTQSFVSQKRENNLFLTKYRGLLTEIARCLKPNGKAIFEEVFYSPTSQTYRYLVNENAVYASSETYVKFRHSVGLRLSGIDICQKSIGKVDPGDGLPFLESDEGYRKNIYLVERR